MRNSRTRPATIAVGFLTAMVAGATALVAVAMPTTMVGGEAGPAVAIVQANTPPATTTVTVTVPAPNDSSVGDETGSSTGDQQPDPQTAPADPGDTADQGDTDGAGDTADQGDTNDQGDTPGAGVDADTADAVTVIESYWTTTFKKWDIDWVGPKLWHGDGFYDSSSTAQAPTCGEPAPAMNAFFCGADSNTGAQSNTGFVAWDRQLLNAGYKAFGDKFVYLVLAHEWGHVAQARLTDAGAGDTVVAQQELQADCMAGATLAGAVDTGALELDSADTDELVDSLQAMGDNHRWAGEGDHGSSAQRVSWFQEGFDGGLQQCLGSNRT